MHIGIHLSTYDLKDSPTSLNGSSNSVISGITTEVSFSNMYKHYSSVKNSSQHQSSKYFLDNSIYLKDTNQISSFDKRSLKNVSFKSTNTHECSTLDSIKSNRYLNSLSIHNDTTNDNFRNTTYDAYVPSIENE